MQVCVVGAGVLGCAIGLELRRRGFDVTVLDRNGEVGHGSTAGSCGIVRRFYSQPGMVALAHESALAWAAWSEYLGPIDEELAVFHQPGMLFIPPAIDAEVHRIVDSMREAGVRVSVLDAAQVKERFPYLDTGAQYPPCSPEDPRFLRDPERPIEGAVFEEAAGYVVSPGLATHNLRRAAERDGVTFLLNREVLAIRPASEGRFEVETTGGSVLRADVVVNVAGPHSAIVNERAGVTLPLETRALRREVHALTNPLAGDPEGASLPVVGDLDAGIYLRPETGGRDLIVGSLDPECDELEWVEPDDFNEGVTALYRDRQVMRAMKRLPVLEMGPNRGIGALYDVTLQDWYPIVDRTDRPGFYVCMGTSGSSFKTAPVLGRLVTELIAANEAGRDTDREPIQLELPRAGLTVDTGFLSRRRAAVDSTSTVIG